MTLAEQIAAASAGEDTTGTPVQTAGGESLKTKSGSGQA